MRRHWTAIAAALALMIPSAVAQTAAQPTPQQTAQPSAQQGGAQTATQSGVTDATLQSNVQGKLATDAAFKSVVISVRGGVVDLTGTVPSEPDQKRAKEMASQVPGVKNVTDHLSIGEAGAAAASTAGAAVPQTAQSETTKNTAGSIAGNAGAIGSTTGDTTPSNPAVSTQSAAGANTGTNTQGMPSQNLTNSANSLGMTPDVDSNTLRSQIDSALKSDPTLGNAQVSVDVNATQITLSGSVPSGKEKQTAVRIAQSYAGNRRVSDKVTLAGRQTPPQTQTQNPNAIGTNPK
jgi:osmotically-inducible protein OsmY